MLTGGIVSQESCFPAITLLFVFPDTIAAASVSFDEL